MKKFSCKFYLFLVVYNILLFVGAKVYSQVPQALNYQAVARDNSGQPLLLKNITIKFTILDYPSGGNVLYAETHVTKTDNLGLFNLKLGGGNPIYTYQLFSDIPWSVGEKWLNVELDVSGSGSFIDMGTTQLLSVPFALYAAKSGNDNICFNLNDAYNCNVNGGIINVVPARPLTITDDQNYSPQLSALMDIKSSTKGILIPRVTSTILVNNPANGLLVYQTSDNTFYYYDGAKTKWIAIGGVGTLNDAYNYGGVGAGRLINITTASVPVEIKYSVNETAGIGLKVSNITDGVSISAENTSSSSKFSTIQSITSATNPTNGMIGAVGGVSKSNAYGIVGQAMVTTAGLKTAGVFGSNLNTTGGYGVYGNGSKGVYGSGTSRGVVGDGNLTTNTPAGDTAVGVLGTGWGSPTYGVVGQTVLNNNIDPNGFGLYSRNNLAVQRSAIVGDNLIVYDTIATNNLFVYQDLEAYGTKNFKIDHPLDPENKFLKHSCIESPEVLNVYRGNVILDANGEAIVSLPDYFSAININYSYNLTAVGESAPGLFIKNKIKGNSFIIAGGKPNIEVSWSVYAERNDLYVQKHPETKKVEIEKSSSQKGKYLMPILYSQPAKKGILFNNKYILSHNKNNKPLKLFGDIQPKPDIKALKLFNNDIDNK